MNKSSFGLIFSRWEIKIYSYFGKRRTYLCLLCPEIPLYQLILLVFGGLVTEKKLLLCKTQHNGWYVFKAMERVCLINAKFQNFLQKLKKKPISQNFKSETKSDDEFELRLIKTFSSLQVFLMSLKWETFSSKSFLSASNSDSNFQMCSVLFLVASAIQFGLSLEYNNKFLERTCSEIRSNWKENNTETCLGRSFCYWNGKFGNFPSINDRYSKNFKVQDDDRILLQFCGPKRQITVKNCRTDQQIIIKRIPKVRYRYGTFFSQRQQESEFCMF